MLISVQVFKATTEAREHVKWFGKSSQDTQSIVRKKTFSSLAEMSLDFHGVHVVPYVLINPELEQSIKAVLL